MLTRRSMLAAAAAAASLNYAKLALADTPPGVLVMAMQIDDIASGLDPAESFEFSGGEVIGNVYRKLVTNTEGKPGTLEGDLAETWTGNQEGTEFTFKLKSGQVFASGKPVTSADVVYSFQRVVALNKSPAFIINQFGFTKDNMAERITAPDASTVVLKTAEPTAITFLLFCLSAAVGSIVEKAAVEAQAKDNDYGNGWLKQNSAGGGAYTLRSWQASNSIMLDANSYNQPKIRRVIIRHVADPSAQLLGLSRGDFDIVRNLAADQITQIRSDDKYKIITQRRANLLYLSLSQKNQYLAKPEVRQAIKMALDYDGIQKNIVPTTFAVHQAFLPEGLPGALTAKPFKQDIAGAKALLAKAGLPDGFEVSFDYTSSAPYSDIAQAIQANLAQIGVRLRMLPGQQGAVITKTRARQHEIAMVRWGSDYFDPHSNAEAFSVNADNSDGARNRTLAWRASWEIPELTKRTMAAVKESDPQKRIEIYEALQKDHQQQSPFVIMLQEIQNAVTSAKVSGFVVGVMSDQTGFSKTTKS
ncbi:ABC transporter substrate-binding protein [Acetobacteraceae bacterium H6797]|nr:ABC transporter substrate-binding protein [Acetobacteraceae bacterium H6797]